MSSPTIYLKSLAGSRLREKIAGAGDALSPEMAELGHFTLSFSQFDPISDSPPMTWTYRLSCTPDQLATIITRGAHGNPATAMCRISLLMLIVASTTITWCDSKAAGSFQTKPAFPSAATVGVASPSPRTSVPTSDLMGGCGRGRVRDPQTHGCRGPADIR